MRAKPPSTPTKAREFEEHLNIPQVLAYQLKDDGHFPNNSRLALLIYEGAFKDSTRDLASVMEKVFAANHWTGSWRNGVHTFHHYHSTTHEVLGVFSGSAVLQLGGPDGIVQQVRTGDVIVLPAGVSHKNLEQTPDFGVVGAYPDGREADMNHGKAQERAKAEENIAQVPLPAFDPVYGADGPLFEHWLE